MTDRTRRALVALAAATQILGAAGFVIGPGGVFAEIGGNALARSCLRLAGFAHLSFALLVFGLVATASTKTLRWIAGSSVVYHLLAGVEAARSLGSDEIVLAHPRWGPAAFHLVMTLVLTMVAAFPADSRSRASST